MLKPAAHQVAGHAAGGKIQRKQKMSLNRMLFFPPVYVKITKNICFFLQLGNLDLLWMVGEDFTNLCRMVREDQERKSSMSIFGPMRVYLSL